MGSGVREMPAEVSKSPAGVRCPPASFLFVGQLGPLEEGLTSSPPLNWEPSSIVIGISFKRKRNLLSQCLRLLLCRLLASSLGGELGLFTSD